VSAAPALAFFVAWASSDRRCCSSFSATSARCLSALTRGSSSVADMAAQGLRERGAAGSAADADAPAGRKGADAPHPMLSTAGFGGSGAVEREVGSVRVRMQ